MVAHALFESDRNSALSGSFPEPLPRLSPSPASGDAGTVLLVDDDEFILHIATEMLTILGQRVIPAKDGVEALKQYRLYEDQIDVVFLDLSMPRMGGAETLLELRKINRQVQVVLSSGYSEDKIAELFTGKFLAGFIQKPYSFSVLAQKLAQVPGNKSTAY